MHGHADPSDNIIQYLDQLTAYAQSRLADKDLAADAVQEAVTKAVKGAPGLKDQEKMLPWLYAILRNTIADLARKQAREIATDLLPEQAVEPDSAEQENLCSCFRPLIATLPSDYGHVLQKIDLDEEPREQVAAQLGVSVGNLNVKLHRAREKLRQALENTCNLCAKHGCLNCSCGS